MTDIEAFIRARLDEDEQAAAACEEPSWTAHATVDNACWMEGPNVYGAHTEGYVDRVDAGHIARHDPARVLREVEAKRRILAPHKPRPLDEYDRRVWGFTFECASESWTCYGDGADHVEWPCETVKLLALPYSDHPDYDESWRP